MHLVITTLKKLRIWVIPAFIFVGLTCLSSCNGGSSTTTVLGLWTQVTSINAGARYSGVLFNIDGKVFVGLGYNGNNNKQVFLNDLWYDDPSQGWVKKSSFPGAARQGAVAFVSGGKAYVGLGSDRDSYYKDFYSYDPATDQWSEVQDFKGNARRGAFAFTIDDKGYVGNGNDDDLYYSDFYQYDVANDAWIDKPIIPLIERSYPFSFVIDGKGYVGGGLNNTTLVQDMYEFDPLTEPNGKWTVKNDLRDDKIDTDTNDKGYTIARYQAVTFVIDGKAYVVGGSRNNETWQYSPGPDTWLKMTPFAGSYRIGAVAYTKDNLGYIGAGFSGSGSYYNDQWSFDPTLPTP